MERMETDQENEEEEYFPSKGYRTPTNQIHPSLRDIRVENTSLYDPPKGIKTPLMRTETDFSPSKKIKRM